jgi:hypothetical protein
MVKIGAKMILLLPYSDTAKEPTYQMVLWYSVTSMSLIAGINVGICDRNSFEKGQVKISPFPRLEPMIAVSVCNNWVPKN